MMSKNSYKFKKILPFIISIVVIGIVYLLCSANIISRYNQGILTSICINVVLVASLNLTAGYLGQLTLGHAGFMSIGAYSAALLTKDILAAMPIQISFWVALLISGLVAALLGALVAIACLRLKGDYLAIITLAFGEIIRNILTNINIVGGAKGYMGISRFVSFPLSLSVAIVCVGIIYLMIHSQQGRYIKAIAVDEIASASSGVHTQYYKVATFVIAAFFAGVAGCLYAHYMGNLAPKVFDYNMSIKLLVMVVLGGMGNLFGGVMATIVLTALPEMLRAVSDYQMLAYSLVLIIIMLAKHSPKMNELMQRIKIKRKGNFV